MPTPPSIPFRPLLAAASLAIAVGCSSSARIDESLERDLDAAVSSSIELAPRAAQQGVVSAVELGTSPARAESRAPAPAPRTSREAAAAAPAPRPAAAAPAPRQPPQVTQPAMETTPVREEQVEQPAAVPLPNPSRDPAPKGEGTPPPGGWKTMEEVIRKAPFPINP